MAAIDNDLPTIAIVGPTASGKTGVSLQIAERFGCEIVAADSRTVYRGLDIGTAKPTLAEQAIARHWGLSLIEPNESFSAKQFQDYANDACRMIKQNKKIPLIVGGTGLYIDALMYDFQFPDIDRKLRGKLEGMRLNELIRYCDDNNIILPENNKNHRRLVNTICRQHMPPRRSQTLAKHKHIVGIATNAITLRRRIHERAKQMFNTGVVEEATVAAKVYGWSAPGMSGNIYRIIRELNHGVINREQAIEQCSTFDWQLAKRQMTWFRRDPNILWVQLEEAEEKISQLVGMYM